MSWKRNSLGRLGDITEEENVDRTKEQALLSYQEQQTEALYEEEFENDESKESFTENPEERTEIKAIYDQNSDGQITSQETSKVKINLPLEISEGKLERRKTIYDLDSYVTSSISMHQYYEADEESADLLDKPLGPRYSQSMGLSGIARINLSPLTQKIIGCVIGENVTTEYPWIYVRKEIIEDNLDLHEESSDFLPVRDEINLFPDKKILIGYAPSTAQDEQFYICLTEAGRDAVMKHIETLRLEEEDRVRNAIEKPTGKWKELGSREEVDDTIVKNTRPLFEIEVESTSDVLNAPIKLTNRNPDNQRDGYIELLPYRQSFDYVTRKLVSKSEQASWPLRDNDAQTQPSMLVNSWFQYSYEYEPVTAKAFNDDEKESMRNFIDKYNDYISDKVSQNATWDIYTDDYANLIRNEKDTQQPVKIAYTEYQSYYDRTFSADKVINDLCWHPTWTGIAAATYTTHCKSDYLIGPNSNDEVHKFCEANNQILIWSFNDCLTPKLVLECSREITAVSICPYNGSVIIGGCANGQISIWSIPGKIEETEAVLVQTAAQVKCRIALKSLMTWMRETASSAIIRPAAMSSVQYSQKSPITQIVWLPPYNKIDKNGRISSLPADASADELGWQFATSSDDGTIAFWDLRWRPPEDKEQTGRVKKKKKKARRPNALIQSISPYKALDGIFRPEYMLEVYHPDEERRVVITTMDFYSPMLQKQRVEPSTINDSDLSIRKYYKLIVKKPDYEMVPMILIGTVEGDVGRISWDGYEFITGVVVNRESVKWLWRNVIHDGPVTHAVRSKYLNDVCLTIGGKIFAIWSEDFSEPVIWRKSTVRYTACCWGTFRPTVVILARADGTAEIWDFIVKSHEPSFTQGLSGRIITGIYTHNLYLNPQCIAFCDFNGTLRVFTAPANLLTYDETDIEWMRNFIDREVIRIRQFKRWQKSCNELSQVNIEDLKKHAELEAEKKKLEAENKIKDEMAELMSKEISLKITKSETTDRWKKMELKRMQRMLLEKKGLRADILEQRRTPFLQMRQDVKRKKKKIREIMQQQDKIFEDTVAFLFPEQHNYNSKSMDYRKVSIVQHPDKNEEEITMMKAILDEQHTRSKFTSPNEEIIHDFLDIQRESLESMKDNPYNPIFDWRKIRSEGNVRRQSLDVQLQRSNRRKTRKFVQEMPHVYEQSTERNRSSSFEFSKPATDTRNTSP